MGQCALKGFGKCGGKELTGEHYLSDAALALIFDDQGNGAVSGTPWAQTERNVNRSSLRANILCRDHNSRLSPLDAVGAAVLRSIQSGQIGLQTGTSHITLTRHDGNLFERWLLKVAFGMWESGNFAVNGKRLEGERPAAPY